MNIVFCNLCTLLVKNNVNIHIHLIYKVVFIQCAALSILSSKNYDEIVNSKIELFRCSQKNFVYLKD